MKTSARAALALSMSAAMAFLSAHAAEALSDRTRKLGMAKAPELLKAAGIACTVTDAYKLPDTPTGAGGIPGGAAAGAGGGSGEFSGGAGMGGGGGGGGGMAAGGGGGGGGGTAPLPVGQPLPDRYEVSCQEGLGYLLTAAPGRGAKPVAVTCLEALESATASVAQGGPAAAGGMAPAEGGMGAGMGGGGMGGGGAAAPAVDTCQLPGNSADAQRAAVLALLAKDKDTQCDVDRIRGVGHNAKNTFIEISCKGENADGYMLAASYPVSPSQPVEGIPCLGMPETGAVTCRLTNRQALLGAMLAAAEDLFVKDSGREQCKVGDRRYIATDGVGNSFYEFMCANGTPYIMARMADGKFGGTAECSEKIATDLGGCKLLKPAN